jgi:hypothetical protein
MTLAVLMTPFPIRWGEQGSAFSDPTGRAPPTPAPGETIKTRASKKITFRPAKELKLAV